jgi:hypothetical protein
VTFKYSTDPTLATGVTIATGSFPATASNAAVTQGISGLAAHTLYYYRASATNSGGRSDGAILSFTTLNGAPTAPNGTASATTGDAKTVTISFPTIDADGDAVTITGTTAGAHLTITSFNATTVTFTPDSNYIGAATFTYTVSDGSGSANAVATGTITVSITDNDAPTLSYLGSQSVGLTGSATVSPAGGPSDNIAVQSIAVQSKGTYTGGISVDPATGVATFSNATPSGTHAIVIRATDSSGNTTDAAFSLVVSAAPTPTPAPTATPTPTPIGTLAAVLGNISTRLAVQTGNKVLIGGFIIDGTASKRVLIRGIGPSLTDFGVPGALTNPIVELHQGDSTIASNDDWKINDATGLSQEAVISATTIPPSKDAESAILVTLNPGAYTVILSGKSGTTGIGSVEVYGVSATANAKLVNISTRGFVDTDDKVMIGGFIVGPAGSANTTMVIRAIGPSLTQYGISNALQDPMLELHDANGGVFSNDNWQDDPNAGLIPTSLQPNDPKESATYQTLAPGAYTVIVRGKDNGVGVALVEVYNVQ